MLERLLPFLDIVLLEKDSATTFRSFLPFPHWFQAYYPEAKGPQSEFRFDWPFINDFITRAEDVWKAEKEGSIASGPWSETDAAGKERMLHATAILLSGRKLLMIEPAKVPLEDAQILLQKGRQKSLDFRTVKRKQRSLRKVQQRYLALLDAVPDWILVVHQDGSLLEYSAGREELFENIQPEVGKKISDLLPPDLSAQLLPQIEKVTSSGRPQMWRYREASRTIEILLLATGQDEAMCILRPSGKWKVESDQEGQ